MVDQYLCQWPSRGEFANPTKGCEELDLVTRVREVAIVDEWRVAGIGASQSDGTAAVRAADIVEKAEKFTVLLECWK